MNARLYFTTNDAAAVEPIEELSGVRVTGIVETDGGALPSGACGTVVSVLGSGEAYLVEFEEPFHCLATVSLENLEPVEGESRADLVAAAGASD